MTKPPARDLSLEEAMENLDAIVREMEGGDLPLEKLIVRYEEGVALSKLCQERLDKAEERIKMIVQDARGNLSVEDFDADQQEE